MTEALQLNETAPFVRGSGQWQGVVMIERPKNPDSDTLCEVSSARSIYYNGLRAIYCKLPYGALKHYFTPEDGSHCYVYAEHKDGLTEFYERASKREYFLNASPMVSGAVRH